METISGMNMIPTQYPILWPMGVFAEELEIYSKDEGYTLDLYGVPSFHHTKVIFVHPLTDKYYWAAVPYPVYDLMDINLPKLQLHHIPLSVIFPLAKSTWTHAPTGIPHETYLKLPSLADCGNIGSPFDLATNVTREVEAFEILSKRPHPNIVHYYGCMMVDGRVRGIVLSKHGRSLQEKLDRGVTRFRNGAAIMNGITNAVNHVHSLGLVHNDLNPSNILIDGTHVTLIDFDCCRRIGEPLNGKTGCDWWAIPNAKTSAIDNDRYSMMQLESLLVPPEAPWP